MDENDVPYKKWYFIHYPFSRVNMSMLEQGRARLKVLCLMSELDVPNMLLSILSASQPFIPMQLFMLDIVFRVSHRAFGVKDLPSHVNSIGGH